MRCAWLWIVMAALGLRTVPFAQPVPVFSGTWSLDAARSSRTGAGEGGGRGTGQGDGGGLSIGPTPERVVIEQKEATLTIDEHRGSAIARKVYRVDGTPVDNTIAAGRNAGRTSSSVTRWEGTSLVTTITVPVPGDPTRTATYRETRRLDADGALVVETTFAERQPRLAIYRKQQAPP